MSDETLRELLAKVHERLRTAGSVDRDAQQLLMTVMKDIESALASRAPDAAISDPGAAGRSGPGRSPGAPARAALRLEALAVRFEAGHPALAQLLRQLSELLGQGGF